ncbi:MAG: hypothetical protein LKF37_10210 [Lentilactobacillus diolivorans]|jgi:topoisomerase IA-like protein|nr:hypothetical protein [Lentilactobacillus diolivorans]
MIKNLSRKEEYFVSTEDEALDLIDEKRAGKDGSFIIDQQMTEKVNKYGVYFRVLLEYRFNTPTGIMEVSDEENTTDDTDTEENESEDEK